MTESEQNEILKANISKAVDALIAEKGTADVYHPELGLVVKDGKPTHALIAFFKKLQRKRIKSLQKMSDQNRIEFGNQNADPEPNPNKSK